LLTIAERGIEYEDALILHVFVWVMAVALSSKNKNPTAGSGSGVYGLAIR